MEASERPTRWSLDDILLMLVIAAAFVFSLFHARGLGVIENEGAEYATIARNLHRGIGYVGLHGTPEVYFPPAFPFGIYLATFFLNDYAFAGRVVALLGGTITAIMAGLLAARWGGRRAGFLAAALTLATPLMMGISTAVLSETTYMACSIAGILLIWRAFEKKTTGAFIAAGAVVGAAHLTKPEVMIYATLLIIIRAVAVRREFPGMLRRIPWFFATYLLVILPYMVFLHGHTGKWMVEGKSGLNTAIAIRTSNGETLDEACRLLGDDGRAPGLLLHPMEEVPRYSGIGLMLSHPMTPLTNIVHNAVPLVRAVERTYGVLYVAVAALGFVALFRTSRGRFLYLGLAALVPLVLVSTFWIFSRYVVVVLPLFAVAAAFGVLEGLRWLRMLFPRFASRSGVAALACIAVIAVTLNIWPRVHGVRSAFSQSHEKELRSVGTWLEQNGAAGKHVMCLSTAIPFYADATWITLPLGPHDRTLTYAAQHQAAFVIMRTDSVQDIYFSALSSWHVVHRDSINPYNRLVVLAPTEVARARLPQ